MADAKWRNKYQRPYKSEVSTDRDSWRAIGRRHVRLTKEERDLQEKEKEKKTWEEEQTNGDLQSNETTRTKEKRKKDHLSAICPTDSHNVCKIKEMLTKSSKRNVFVVGMTPRREEKGKQKNRRQRWKKEVNGLVCDYSVVLISVDSLVCLEKVMMCQWFS